MNANIPKKIVFLLLSFLILNSSFFIAHATVRFVSHSGSSTPPYTTWETAADSIQKAIDICVNGDTVIVANGLYKESVYVDRTIWLIGSSMDSTVIDGSDPSTYYLIYFFENNSHFENFNIVGPGQDIGNIIGINTRRTNLKVKNCRVNNLILGLACNFSSDIFENIIINDCDGSIWDQCPADTCNSIYRNNIIISKNQTYTSVDFSFGGYPTFINNIVIEEGLTRSGVEVQNNKGAKIKNNLISGFKDINIKIGVINPDTAHIVNNNILNVKQAVIGQADGGIVTNTGDRTEPMNNIISNSNQGIYGSTSSSVRSDYNLFWKVQQVISGFAYLGSGNIVADPMFVKDTIPTSDMNFDFHLQAFSPGIDKGDPAILDVDGTRSDIGMFGGPLGEKYTYQDLAPKPPSNLTAVYDSGLVKLTWNKNTETDFYRYRIYRDTVANFIYDTTKIIAEIADTFYFDDLPEKYMEKSYYYKLTAIDSMYHQSAASEEVQLIITGVPEGPPIVLEEYKLLNNYPNPFNPSTVIPYRLKEGGYVKLMVYDIKGELLRVLVNEYQGAGYYEVVFSPNDGEIERGKLKYPFETGYRGDIASGIYLYRIEVIGEGNIPVYSNMHKMILVK